MSKWLTTINALVVVGRALLLLLGVWPGLVLGSLIVQLYPLIVVLGLAWAWVAVRVMQRRDAALSGPWLRPLCVAPVLVSFTFLSLVFYVPRRVAFIVVQGEFEQQLPAAPPTGAGEVDLDRSFGPYHVDRWASDERGGIYFRTGTGPDGFIDSMSYGFAYRPNAEGTPFGSARLQLGRIGGGWYWFKASNDW